MQSDIAICIATGASLTQQDVDAVKGLGKVYVVNDAYKLAPWANVLYAADYDWWEHHAGCEEFVGRRVTCNIMAASTAHLEYIKPSKRHFSYQRGQIGLGGNSGYQALNLAVLEGARKIILLGYDMQLAPDGRRHYFGEHPPRLVRNSDYAKWIENFNIAAPQIADAGIKVINCTRTSALNCFPKMDLQSIICEWKDI